MLKTLIIVTIGILLLAMGVGFAYLIWQINTTEMPGLEDFDE
jgi:hypothetical protein